MKEKWTDPKELTEEKSNLFNQLAEWGLTPLPAPEAAEVPVDREAPEAASASAASAGSDSDIEFMQLD